MVYTEVVGITIFYSSRETGHRVHHLKSLKTRVLMFGPTKRPHGQLGNMFNGEIVTDVTIGRWR